MFGKPRLTAKVINYALLFLLALAILFPIYYMLIVSLKLPRDIYRTPSLLPTNATLQNYLDLFQKSGLFHQHSQQPGRVVRLDASSR